jgi:TolB-like protein
MDTLAQRLQASLGDAFTIDRELGGGGMSRVFLARDRALDRQVVIKTLDLAGDAVATTSAERFRREVRTIAKLQHPHIVPLLTAGGDDTLLWYAMPFVAGESLRARLTREGALPLADALRVMRELVDALGFAHEHGLMHRDVKPENVLLEARHAVVADFGIAKALADAGVSAGLTSAGVALGTPAYMAPEQAMADATTNHRADLYSAGAVLYEMLVGAPPFSGNAQAVIAAHLTAPVPNVSDRRKDVPPAVASLIARLLAKNPAERPQSAPEILATLDDVVTPGGTRVHAPATATPVDRPLPNAGRRRARVGVAVAALGVFATVAVGAWWKMQNGAAVADDADVVAVMPLATTGDSALARLGRDLVVTLSANLDGVGALRAVDATTVIMRVPQALPLDQARALARELGARSVLHGSLVHDGPLVRAEVVLAPVDGGDPLVRLSARAAADSVRALTDSLTKGVLSQIWRRGSAPSTVLAEVATSSNEALRAFLNGEALFQRFQWDSAVAEYARAVAADTTFVQAVMRMDYVRSWAQLPPDPEVRARLVRLMHRLPARDRELLDLRLAVIPTRRWIDSTLVLAARYPDYAVAQYDAGDRIIHYGPAVGVPIARAIPYLDRLNVLAPQHADNAFHRLMAADVLGDTTTLLSMAHRLASDRAASMTMSAYARGLVHALSIRQNGAVPNAAQAGAFLESYVATAARAFPAFSWLSWYFPFPFTPPAVVDSSLATAIRSGMFSHVEPGAIAARGNLAIARGDFTSGLALLASVEAARAPVAVRLSAARSATLGSWLGAVPPASADSALSRARATLGTLTGVDAAELAWLDGIVGLVARDSARVARAAEAITDTTAVARRLRSSLGALWHHHRTGQIEPLVALEDSAMSLGVGTFAPTAFVHRLLIGQSLVRAGNPAQAEHYLQWTDTRSFSDLRVAQVAFAFGNYSGYQRALALEAMGEFARAKLHYERFVDMVDKPPPSVKPHIADAKARLARLTGDGRR